MTGWRLLALLLAIPHYGLSAHPHVKMEQQAHLSVGRQKAVVAFYLAPSARDGAHLFGHIDTDRDGRIDMSEKRRFSEALLQRASLIVNGRKIALEPTDVVFPDKPVLASGRGTIRVSAKAAINLRKQRGNRVSFDVTYNRFSPRWFIQPHYFADIALAKPVMKRVPKASSVEITI